MTVLGCRGFTAGLAALLALLSNAGWAAAERYDYDLAGRLVRRVDEQSKSTDYVYDPAGNITQVGAPTPAQPPVITSGALGDFYRNDVRSVSVSGSNLAGVLVRASHAGLSISNLVQSNTAISFRLGVAVGVPLGVQTVIFSNSVGSAQVGLNVVEAPSFVFEPSPISLSPDGIARKYSLRLSSGYPDAKAVSLSTLAPGVARTKETQLNILAGQTLVDFGLVGLSNGTTTLRVGSASLLEPVEALVTVTPGGANRLYLTPGVGISKGLPWSTSPTNNAVSGSIGISKGTPWSSSPDNRAVSSAIGIAKGVPWSSAQFNGPVVAPLVGIQKP